MFCTYKIIEHINPIRDSKCHKGWRMLAESRALIAMVAMFLQWAESSLNTTRASGTKTSAQLDGGREGVNPQLLLA